MVQLRNSSLLIDAALVSEAFGDDELVSLVYYSERSTLLIAGKSKAFFDRLHKTHWAVLKVRNQQGDRTVNVRDLILDFDIDDTDRALSYELKSTGILSISF